MAILPYSFSLYINSLQPLLNLYIRFTYLSSVRLILIDSYFMCYQTLFLEKIMNISKPVKTIVSTAALCCVIAFTSVASVNASDLVFDGDRQHHVSKHKLKRLAKMLSLSEEQQTQIKAIKAQAKEQHQGLRESMKQFKAKEKELLQAKLFDEKAYGDLHDAYQPIFTQRALMRVKTKHAIFNVLTPVQQEKWLETLEHHKGRGKKKCG